MRNLVATLLVLLLIAGLVPVAAFAEEGSSQGAQDTQGAQSTPPSNTEESLTEESSTKDQENETGVGTESATTNNDGQVPSDTENQIYTLETNSSEPLSSEAEDDGVRNLALSAALAGTPLNNSATLPSTRVVTALNTAKALTIEATFTPSVPGRQSTEHTVVITLRHGLAFSSIPGMAQNAAGEWVPDYDSLSNIHKTTVSSVSFVPDDPITLSNGSVQPGSGVLTYVFTDETHSASLVLGVVLDSAYSISGGGTKVFSEPLWVQALEKVNDQQENTDLLKLKNYSVQGRLSPVDVPVGYGPAGGTATFEIQNKLYADYYASGVPFGNQMITKAVFQIKLLDGTKWTLDPDTGVTISKDSALYGVTPQVTVNPAGDYAYITFEDFYLSSEKPNNFTITIGNASYSDQQHRGDTTITPYPSTYNGQEDTGVVFGAVNNRFVSSVSWLNNRNTGITGMSCTIVSGQGNLSLNKSDAGEAHYGVYYISPSEHYANDAFYLGNAPLMNTTSAPSGKHGVQINFPTTNVKVREVFLPVGTDNTAHNITVHLSSGGSFTLEEYSDRPSGANIYNKTVRFVLGDYDVASTDSIVSLEYELIDLPAGYASEKYSNSIHRATNVLSCYGYYVGSTSSFSIKVTTHIGGIPEGSDWSKETNTKTTNIPVISNKRWHTIKASFPNANTHYTAGDTFLEEFQVESANYGNSGQTGAGNYALSYYLKGINIYVRIPDGMKIDLSTIQVAQLEKTGSTSAVSYDAVISSALIDPSEYTVTPTTDKDGKTVYKISGANFRVGQFSAASGNNLALRVSYELSIAGSAADVVGLPMNARVFMDAMDPSSGIKSYQIPSYDNHVFDVYDVNGIGGTTDRISTAPVLYTYSISSADNFRISTYAHRVLPDGTDSGWKQYQASDASTVLAVSPYTTNEYKVTVENKLDKDVVSYAVHVPIPKRGEMFGSNYFTWSAAIDTPVLVPSNLPLGTKLNIVYSKEYVAEAVPSQDQLATFEEWDPANASEYRTVRIAATSNPSPALPDGESLDYLVSLVVDEDAQDYGITAGKRNVFASTAYYEMGTAGQVTSVAKVSERSAFELNVGAIFGQVYNDLNKDNVYNNADTPRAGATVNAYKDSELVATTTTEADGSFTLLSEKVTHLDAVDVEVVSGATDDSERFSADPLTAQLSYTQNDIQADARTADEAGLVVGILTPYKVRFFDNYPEGTAGEVLALNKYVGEQVTVADAKSAEAQLVAPEGYYFAGWKVQNITASFPYFLLGDVDYYAVWKPLNYNYAIHHVAWQTGAQVKTSETGAVINGTLITANSVAPEGWNLRDGQNTEFIVTKGATNVFYVYYERIVEEPETPTPLVSYVIHHVEWQTNTQVKTSESGAVIDGATVTADLNVPSGWVLRAGQQGEFTIEQGTDNAFYVYYEQEKESEVTVTPPPSTVTPTTPPTPSETAEMPTLPGAVPGSPVINIFGYDVPLFGVTGGSWSLLNLICTVMMGLVALVGACWAFVRRRKDEKSEHEREANQQPTKETDESKKRILRPVFFVISMVAAVALIVLFIITQDITLPVALFDLWSIVFVVCLAVGSVCTRLSFGKKNYENQEEAHREPVKSGDFVEIQQF